VGTAFEPAAEPKSGFDPLGWAWGQCTAFAAEMAGWVQGDVKGNATNWLSSGKAAGLATSSTPAPGDVAVFSGSLPGSGGYGHVAVVTAVGSGEFDVDQGNVEGVDVASAGQYSDASPYLEGFLVPPNAADAAQTLASAYDVTGLGSVIPAAATATTPTTTTATGATSTSSAGAVLAANAVSGLGNVVDSLQSWFDTPRLIAFGVAAVVLYMGYSSTLQGGPTASA
jgi:surface antigen